MGLLNKLFGNVRINDKLIDHVNDDDIYNVSNRSVGPVQTVRVNSTVVDQPNSNELYNASTQTIGSGNESVAAAEADVTGETFVEASRGTKASGISATTWTNIVDTEDTDNLGEFDENSNAQINPNETGYYLITGLADVEPGADGDLIQMRVQDVDSPSTIQELGSEQVGGTSQFHRLPFATILRLTAGTNYEVQTRDLDSTFAVDTASRATIVRQVVHP